jgi:alcohol dehydrogenase, propanol-preferring
LGSAVRGSLPQYGALERNHASEMLELAPSVGVRTKVSVYGLEDANAALDDLRKGRFTGAAVIVL